MNILYCGDKNIEKGLIISILSLLKNVKEKLNIYVLTIKISEKQDSYMKDELQASYEIAEPISNSPKKNRSQTRN